MHMEREKEGRERETETQRQRNGKGNVKKKNFKGAKSYSVVKFRRFFLCRTFNEASHLASIRSRNHYRQSTARHGAQKNTLSMREKQSALKTPLASYPRRPKRATMQNRSPLSALCNPLTDRQETATIEPASYRLRSSILRPSAGKQSRSVEDGK